MRQPTFISGGKEQRDFSRRPGGRLFAIAAILLSANGALHAADADGVAVKCSLDRTKIEAGSAAALVAKADATDRKKHPLAYVWSGDGGKIRGAGSQVEVDASSLKPGSYSLTVVARDAFANTAECSIAFDVMETVALAPAPKAADRVPLSSPAPSPPVKTTPPAPVTDFVTVACATKTPVVEQGKDAEIEADARDPMGHSLRYLWYANGGTIEGQGPFARLQTAGVMPAEYTVTARVEDDLGHAGDCNVEVRIDPPAPPPVPLQPSNIGQIVFPANRATWDAKAPAQLAKVVERMKSQKGRVSIESYAGPDERTPGALATERAQAVKSYFMQNGIDESRISTFVGLGGRRGGVRNRTLDVIWVPDGLEY